jgi:ArsR family transcriptional regulator
LLKQSQPAVSHHLALLKMAGLIECRRDGKHNFYHIMPKRFQQYLETVFGGGEVNRKIRVEDSVISYAKDSQAV